ncbi:helix-turn-helix domain-containing protein [Maribacter sp. 2304DJ31-5]|uniref:helix-turn-helix domain-containing protein n=1 Tax=Maribacter sp. 2304DJ31-5 TaxID=3386273 RepID=UPI0039BCE04D
MDLVGKRISESRKAKGLTQEELAELSQVNLRTIQRLENNENKARGKTLDLICKALQINTEELLNINSDEAKTTIGTVVVNGMFLIILNLILITIIGYLTVAAGTNFNSRFGAFLLSFFIPIFMVNRTPHMSGIERMLKFGTGFMTYLIMILALDVIRGLETCIIPCLVLSLAILFFGKRLFGNGVL